MYASEPCFSSPGTELNTIGLSQAQPEKIPGSAGPQIRLLIPNILIITV